MLEPLTQVPDLRPAEMLLGAAPQLLPVVGIQQALGADWTTIMTLEYVDWRILNTTIYYSTIDNQNSNSIDMVTCWWTQQIEANQRLRILPPIPNGQPSSPGVEWLFSLGGDGPDPCFGASLASGLSIWRTSGAKTVAVAAAAASDRLVEASKLGSGTRWLVIGWWPTGMMYLCDGSASRM